MGQIPPTIVSRRAAPHFDRGRVGEVVRYAKPYFTKQGYAPADHLALERAAARRERRKARNRGESIR